MAIAGKQADAIVWSAWLYFVIFLLGDEHVHLDSAAGGRVRLGDDVFHDRAICPQFLNGNVERRAIQSLSLEVGEALRLGPPRGCRTWPRWSWGCPVAAVDDDLED